MAWLHSTIGTTCKQCTNHSFRIKIRLLLFASHFDNLLILIKTKQPQNSSAKYVIRPFLWCAWLSWTSYHQCWSLWGFCTFLASNKTSCPRSLAAQTSTSSLPWHCRTAYQTCDSDPERSRSHPSALASALQSSLSRRSSSWRVPCAVKVQNVEWNEMYMHQSNRSHGAPKHQNKLKVLLVRSVPSPEFGSHPSKLVWELLSRNVGTTRACYQSYC